MSTSGERAIRVFVSSTFRDMQEERDELIKRVFPALRHRCEQRLVAWGEVDLRWGITDEQRAEGQVLPLCLAEIRNCRPFFIGLLGERYGWVPEQLPGELAETEPWLWTTVGSSVTELEILHGVLNDPAMAGHALFYFRDPAYIDGLPPDQREDFREPVALGAEKLRRLKARIRGSGLPLVEGYRDPRALGDRVLADLGAIIDRLYPEGSEPDQAARETAGHEAFARSRARAYVGRAETFQRLDAHADGSSPPLVVTGESGLGKSALLANWIAAYQKTHPTTPVIAHYIGATAESTDWAALARRILNGLSRWMGVALAQPNGAAELRQAVAAGLAQAGARGRVVLVIDGLNQLEDREGAPDLVWLPRTLPPNVRLVLSSLPGRSLDEAARRGWPTLEVHALDQDERAELIERYLAEHRKTLSASRVATIASTPAAANPLFLRALLEELRLWGEHETLDPRIRHYLAAANPAELFARILERWEGDYERERSGLVRDALTVLWASRRGLSQAELLELLGARDEPLPGAYWSPLFLAAEAALLDRGGLLGFAHDHIRQAVETRYLRDGDARRAAHVGLARYFDAQPASPRVVDELPWQLAAAEDWDRLGRFVSDPVVAEAMWKRARFDLRRYWALLEERSRWRLLDAYQDLIRNPDRRPYAAYVVVATLLSESGHGREAHHLYESWSASPVVTEDPLLRGAGFLQLAQSYLSAGEVEQALEHSRRAEGVFAGARYDTGVAQSRGLQAGAHRLAGDLKTAVRLYDEAEAIFRRTADDPVGLAVTLNNRAGLRGDLNDIKGFLADAEEAERIYRELADERGVATALKLQARALGLRKDRQAALTKLLAAEELYRRLGARPDVADCMASRAALLFEQGDTPAALDLAAAAERIHREVGDRRALANTLFNQANVLCRKKATRTAALEKAEEAHRLFVELKLAPEATQARGLVLRIRAGNTTLVRSLVTLLVVTLVVGSAVYGAVRWSRWLWVLAGPMALMWLHVLATIAIPPYRRAFQRQTEQMTAELRLEEERDRTAR